MNKTDLKGKGKQDIPVLKYRTYSISEILNAGGTTAFANQLGKNPENIKTRLKKLSQDSFLTYEEAEQAMKLLDANK